MAKIKLVKRTTHQAFFRAHHMTFKKWWAEIEVSWTTMSIAKYCHAPRKEDGLWVVESIDKTAMEIDALLLTFGF